MDRLAVLNTGNICNQKCIFCFHGVSGKKNTIIPVEKIQDSISLISRNKDRLLLAGGEPLLHPNIRDFIVHARKSGCEHIELETNGRYLEVQDNIATALEYDLDVFRVSVHDMMPEMNQYLTSTAGSFFKMRRKILEKIKMKKELSISILINKSNFRNLGFLAKYIIQFQPSNVYFEYPIQGLLTHAEYIKIMPHVTMVSVYLKRALSIFSNARIPVFLSGYPFCLLDSFEYQVLHEKRIYHLFDELNFKSDPYCTFCKSNGCYKDES